MDLLKQEDVERNSQVIAVGYGLEYDDDDRNFDKALMFTRMEIFKENEEFELNLTIYTKDPYSTICSGRT